MNFRCVFVFVLCIASLAGPTGVAAENADRHLVGVAKVEITPNHMVLLSGYAGRTGMTSDVSEPLWARALAVGTEGQTPSVMIAVDNCGVPLAVSNKVAEALAESHGLKRANVVVCSTHTHNAPMLTDVLPNLFVRDFTDREQAAIDGYTEHLTEKLIAVAKEALANRRPAKLSWTSGVVRFAINRRNAQGPVDHSLPVLRAEDENGKTIAVLVNYACHAVTLGAGNFIGGDWPGYAAQAIEERFPDATALVIIGCGADQNPDPRGGPAEAKAQGESIANEIARLFEQPLKPVTGDLRVTFNTIALPFAEIPSVEQWEQRAKMDGIAGYHAQKQLRRIAAGEQLRTELTYPVQTWTFGESLGMVFLGGEVVVDYSELLRGKLDPARLWVTAYSNDVACYIPSERVLREGGYEGGGAMVWYDQPGPLATGVEALIVDEVTRQAPEKLRSEVDTSRTGGKRPLSPAESLARMKTHDELHIELVVSEPLVVDPVAIDFGPDGKLWVAEMHDYPEGLDGAYQPGGRIKYLEDLDGDGQYDRATVLLDNVPFPTGVMAWRNGVLICAAPDVIYAEDTDGDGRADVQRKVLTGFETHNYQARVNSLSLGLDNWIYGAGGLFGGNVKTAEGEPRDVTNRDFRIRPDLEVVEPVSGRTQQGRARDDWDNWFGCTNGSLLTYYPLTERYYTRNPHIAPPAPETGAAPSNRVFPRGQLVQFALSGPAGVATSACGLGIYRDHLLGDQYYINSFVCEPVNQLVHRLIIEPAATGTLYKGRRAENEEQTEFLTSTDNWFRPVQVRTGPDGALWVVDMYRYVIEHPRFITDEVKANLDVRAGDDRGRIYRIVPRGAELPKVPRVRDLSTTELVDVLRSSNGTLRDLAHLELLWRGDKSAAPHLAKLIRSAEAPQVRVQALAAMDAIGALDRDTVLAALKDEAPGVRRHAVRLAEPFLAQGEDDSLLDAVIQLADDEDVHVRLQVAYSLGESPAARTGDPLARLALSAGNEPYLVGAALSSLHAKNVGVALACMYREADQNASANALLGQVLNLAAAIGEPEALQGVIDVILEARDGTYELWQFASIPGMLEAITRRDAKLDRAQTKQLAQMLDAARNIVEDESASVPLRVAAAGLLPFSAKDALEEEVERLTFWLEPQAPPDLQRAAVATLGKIQHPSASDTLLASWRQLTPALQSLTLDTLLSRESTAEQLLDRVAEGEIPAGQIDAARRQVLLNHRSEKLRNRAAELFAAPTSAELAKLFEQYRDVDATRGNPRRGREAFVKHCAACHQLDGIGHAVGPDLAALSDKSTAYLLKAVLDPNAAIDQRYAAYAAATIDGQVITGMLAAEVAGSITLKAQEGKEHVISRGDLEQLINTGKSYMPEGLAQEIPPEMMSDLLAYVASGGLRARYQALGAAGPHANYPDNPSSPKLVDGNLGTERFDDGNWVGFRQSGTAPQPLLAFDLGTSVPLRAVRITYGVNHQPGGIHAPDRLMVTFSEDGQTFDQPIEFTGFDDSPDGLGAFQIAQRTVVVPLEGRKARHVRLNFRNDSEWTFLSEIRFEGVLDDDSGSEDGSAAE